MVANIGIYDAYWNTRGGGERYAAGIAEVLSRHFSVDLIGVEPVDVEGLAAHLGVDLGRTSFQRWPPIGCGDFARRSREYDLFINVTFGSCMRSEAKASAYVVLFPHALANAPWPRALGRVLGWEERLIPRRVTPKEGFFGVDPDDVCWSKGRARMRVSPRAFDRDGQARLRLRVLAGRTLREVLEEAEAPGVEVRVDGETLVLRMPTRPGRPVDVAFRCRAASAAELWGGEDEREVGVGFALSPLVPGIRKVRRLIHSRRQSLAFRDPAFLKTYDVVLSISQYTSGWVERRWGVPSEILCPPVDTESFFARPEAKQKVILSVGRFFQAGQGSHNKKHREMLGVFRRMCDRGLVPEGWSLHLVGNVHRDRPGDFTYFDEVRRLAEGYPVRLLTDLPIEGLRREYEQASIFWHAAGWGENPRRWPDRFEHFGISTCEAMSAGSIPVVIGHGGQAEIVEHGRTGLLFHDAAQLAEHTRRLIEGHGSEWVREMRARAVHSARRYGLDAFRERLMQVLDTQGLLPGARARP